VHGEISFIDTQIGRLLNSGRHRHDPEGLDNAWIIFTSDHGDMQGDHNLWRKTYAYEGSARIPFLVVPPRRWRQGLRRCAEEVVELRDVMPTLLEAAGLAIPRTVTGRSLAPLLTAPAADWREYLHGEHCTCYSPEQEMQYVTDGRRKLIWFPRLDREQFFDLDQDPGECRDLIADPARQAEIARWRGFLTRELESRNCGWTRNGRPFCPSDEPLVSPYRDVRWKGPGA
jgi:arylsulfatase A-like enzyme